MVPDIEDFATKEGLMAYFSNRRREIQKITRLPRPLMPRPFKKFDPFAKAAVHADSE